MRKFFVAILLMLGIVFILGRISEMESMVRTLQEGDWRYLLAAVLLAALWMLTNGASYRAILAALGIERSLWQMTIVAAACNFANVVAPAAGASGMAVLVADARRQGYSIPRATLAAALFLEFDYLGFMSILALGLLVLFRRNDLTVVEISASAVFLVVAVTLGFLIYLGTKSAERLQRALLFLGRIVNRLVRPFNKKDLVSEERAQQFAHDAAEGLHELRGDPKRIILPVFLAMCGKVTQVVILMLVFLAFQAPIAIGTIIASYSIAHLFMIVSPTPAGIGVVEGMLAISLISMHVEKGAATVITLAYRAIIFWLPLLTGFFAFNWIGHKRS